MAQVGRIIPGTEENDPVQAAERSPAAQARGDALRAEFLPLVDLGVVELAKRKLWNDFREIGLKLGLTPAGVNTAFTKVLQAGMSDVSRISLRTFCMEDGGRRVPWFRSLAGTFPLRYCRHCAADDRGSGRPHYWRTTHQHPRFTACHLHEVLLTSPKEERLGQRKIFHPADHIDLAVATESASDAEIWIARELSWLLTTESNFPAGEQVAGAMRDALAGTFQGSSGGTWRTNAIVEGLQASITSDAAARLRLNLSTKPLEDYVGNNVRWNGDSAHFPFFSLMSFLLRMPLADLFEKASLRAIHLQAAA